MLSLGQLFSLGEFAGGALLGIIALVLCVFYTKDSLRLFLLVLHWYQSFDLAGTCNYCSLAALRLDLDFVRF